MSDKFLGISGGSSGNVNISNGSTVVYASILGASNLEPSQPIKTNSVRQLVSSKLNISDTTNLASELSTKNELNFTHNDSSTNPPSNSVKLYSKSDGFLYSKDELGVETQLGSTSAVGSTWRFKTYTDFTSPTVSNGDVAFNNTNPLQVEQILLSIYSSEGTSILPILELVNSGDTILIKNNTETNIKLFHITGKTETPTYFILDIDKTQTSQTDTNNFVLDEVLGGTLHVSGNPFNQVLNTDSSVSFSDIKTKAGSTNNHIEFLKSTNDAISSSFNLYNSQNDLNLVNNNNFKQDVGNNYFLNIANNGTWDILGQMNINSDGNLILNGRTPNKTVFIRTGGTNRLELIDNIITFKNLGGGIEFKNDCVHFNNDVLDVRFIQLNRDIDFFGTTNKLLHNGVDKIELTAGLCKLLAGWHIDSLNIGTGINMNGNDIVNGNDIQVANITNPNGILTLQGNDPNTVCNLNGSWDADILFINNRIRMNFGAFIDMNSNKITSLADGVDPSDVVNKGQLDNSISNVNTDISTLEDKTQHISANVNNTNFTSNINMNNNAINNISGIVCNDLNTNSLYSPNILNVFTPILMNDYFQSGSYVESSEFKCGFTGAVITATNIDMRNTPIINCKDPVNNQDVANKQYVDGLTQNIPNINGTNVDFNIIQGDSSMPSYVVGNNCVENIAIGRGSMFSATNNCINNISIGKSSFVAMNTSAHEDNIAIGTFSGSNVSNTGQIQRNVYLGYDAGNLNIGSTISNSVAIGSLSKLEQSGEIVLGSNQHTLVRSGVDNFMDFGSVSKRWKDGYFSGTINSATTFSSSYEFEATTSPALINPSDVVLYLSSVDGKYHLKNNVQDIPIGLETNESRITVLEQEVADLKALIRRGVDNTIELDGPIKSTTF